MPTLGRIQTKLGLMLQQRRRVDIAKGWDQAMSTPSTSPFLTPFLPLLLEIGPARGFGERCKLPQRGLGRSPSRNRIRCVLASKYDIWWKQ